ncbi:MAG: hypothetical protein GSR85_05645 [Desulfurococcales archaeon]|nr:hypothetical protein [Desulfurococcales archaeon]
MLKEILLGIDLGLIVSLLHTSRRLRMSKQHLLLLTAMKPTVKTPQSTHSFTINMPPRLRISGELKPPREVLRYGLLITITYNALLATCIITGCI